MAYFERPCNRTQPFLLPPSLQEWLPPEHLAWFVIDAIGDMDLSAFHAAKRDDPRGVANYSVSMMLPLLMYSYCRGIRSSRVIERLCSEDIAYRVLCASEAPDHSTIARFREQHDDAMNTVFTEVLRLCAEAGMVKLGVVALDGTKMEASASMAANRTRKALEAAVKEMLREAAEIDAREDALYGPDKRGDELPADLADPHTRLERLRAAKKRLDEQQAEREAQHAEMLEKRAQEEKRQGRKLSGRKPKAPEEDEEAKANITDPDSRLLKTQHGFVQGYNVQAIATTDQVVIATEVVDAANDVQQLVPMVKAMDETLKAAGMEDPKVGTLLVDAGYWSEANATAITDLPVADALIATTKDWKRRKQLREQGLSHGPMPEGMSLADKMEWRLRTETGHDLYAQRGRTIEPVFGQGKERGGRRFMRRGNQAVAAENKLMYAAHNLLKLFRHRIAHRTPLDVAAVHASDVLRGPRFALA